MPRARTGTLVYKRTTGWNARVWVYVKDDASGAVSEERRWVPLGTHDKELARRKLAKIVAGLASGEIVAETIEREAKHEETFAEYAKAWGERRKAAGVAMARDEIQYLTAYALPHIGHHKLRELRPMHVRAVLDAAVTSGLQRESVRKVRAIIGRVLDSAWKAEIIAENPVDRVEVPAEAPVDERPRTILSDEQLLVFLRAEPSGPNGSKPRKDTARRLLELKTMAVCARVLGGMRSSEVKRWDWTMFDLFDFALVKVQRSKAKRGRTPKVQPFIVPDAMRPILRAWHAENGSPTAGPVFPVTKGERKGEARVERGASFAARLRRELWRAGVRDHAVHHDTPTSRRVDFHSFRRAFATSLAEGNVNEQRARLLSNHGDASVHARYVQQTRAMQTIPEAAVPPIDALAVVGKVTAVTEHSIEEPDRSRSTLFSSTPGPIRTDDIRLRRPGEDGPVSRDDSRCAFAWADAAREASRCCPVSFGEKAPRSARTSAEKKNTSERERAELVWN